MECENCKGEGRVVRKAYFDKLEGISYPEATIDCYECNGTGEICDECGEAINVCDGIHEDDEDE